MSSLQFWQNYISIFPFRLSGAAFARFSHSAFPKLKMDSSCEPAAEVPSKQTLLVSKTPETWHITISLYRLFNPKVVYEAVVKSRFPAAFLDPVMLTGNPLDLQIAARKAVDRAARNTMITKSLPMEFLVSVSPRTQISDSLRTFGFRPADKFVLVVWLHSAPSPPQAELDKLLAVMKGNGEEVSLEKLSELRDMTKIANYYKFDILGPKPDGKEKAKEWTELLIDFVTSQIATKQ
ncbi:hypothetical protein RvY_07644 [Ramazzottius varieornatus]|uniref:EKC/KEOPS complex subunit CGI121 n=1 Tax=Ramazzottius varieornatus TaxID=947166 RepID=A0A1D1VCC6_RAMVA|nr:hypothetical protein RvY_07644 [Ramazzottius varieornatus]